jgi:hypothetical protein
MSPLLPVGIDAHARPQPGHGLDGVSADLEGAQVEVAGRAGRAPAGILATRGDLAYLDGDGLVAQGRRAHVEAVANLEVLHEVFAQVEAQPDVAEIDQRQQRYAGRDVFARVRAGVIDLRRHRRLHRELCDLGLQRGDRGLGLGEGGLRHTAFLDGVAVDGFVERELGLLLTAPGYIERRRRLVELLHRGELARGQLPGAIVVLLGQLGVGLGGRESSPAGIDDLGSRADLDALEIGGGHGTRRLGLLQPGQQLGIVDRHQDLPGLDVLAAMHRPGRHAAIDAGGDVDARGIRLALNNQGLRPGEVP